MKVKVKKLFADTQAGVDRLPGETFECTKDRAEEILDRLGDEFVELVQTARRVKKVEEK